MIGKKIRLERIMDRNTHRTVLVPMDHGMTVGPMRPNMPPKKSNMSKPGGLMGAIHETNDRAMIDKNRQKKVLAALDRIEDGAHNYTGATKSRLMQEAHNKGWRKMKRSPEQPGM